MPYCPVLYISRKSGLRVERIFPYAVVKGQVSARAGYVMSLLIRLAITDSQSLRYHRVRKMLTQGIKDNTIMMDFRKEDTKSTKHHEQMN